MTESVEVIELSESLCLTPLVCEELVSESLVSDDVRCGVISSTGGLDRESVVTDLFCCCSRVGIFCMRCISLGSRIAGEMFWGAVS